MGPMVGNGVRSIYIWDQWWGRVDLEEPWWKYTRRRNGAIYVIDRVRGDKENGDRGGGGRPVNPGWAQVLPGIESKL